MPIIIIIIRHQSCLDRPVLTSSNCLFEGFPSPLRPFSLQFSTIFAVLLLFNLVSCRSQFGLYLLGFPVKWFRFQHAKNISLVKMSILQNVFSVIQQLMIRSTLFWVITQRVVVILYRCFGPNYRSHPQGSRIQNKFCNSQ